MIGALEPPGLQVTKNKTTEHVWWVGGHGWKVKVEIHCFLEGGEVKVVVCSVIEKVRSKNSS